jgi:hypothetical protein
MVVADSVSGFSCFLVKKANINTVKEFRERVLSDYIGMLSQ